MSTLSSVQRSSFTVWPFVQLIYPLLREWFTLLLALSLALLLALGLLLTLQLTPPLTLLD